MTSKLDALLEANRAFDSFYKNGLSNHLSMALIALARMGAGDELLQTFFDRYSVRLEPKSVEAPPITDLAATLMARSLGVGAAAFHGLIQTAYAIEHGDEREIARSLEAWERMSFDVGRSTTFVEEISIELPKLGNIHERMKYIAATEAFAGKLTTTGDIDDAALCDYSIRGYFATKGNFTALHLVTAVDAFLFVDDRYPLDRPSLVAALSAANLSIVDARQEVEITPPTRSWDELRAEAIRSPNDHTIKLAYSCERLAKRTGDDRYRSIVEHRLTPRRT